MGVCGRLRLRLRGGGVGVEIVRGVGGLMGGFSEGRVSGG